MLNEQLWNLLVSCFKDVKIAKSGQPFVWIPDPINRTSIKIIDYGETYRINCPFCTRFGDPDHRYRLWISHAYGTFINKKRRWNLATCFHNNCLEDEAVRDELRQIITGKASDRYINPVVVKSNLRTHLEFFELPGSCIRISELDLNHKSNQFLLSRGIDPIEADKIFEIYYCFDSDKYPIAIDKLVFPIVYNGKRVSWQCRYIGTPPRKSIPKYYSAPGSSIKNYLYNYDLAIKQDFVVIAEGILDVLKIGLRGIALFGKTLSSQQLSLLNTIDKPLVLFLDPDAKEDSEKIIKILKHKNLLPILDANNDPGKLSKEELDAYFQRIGLLRSVS